jgi:DNA-binding MarR family transcriptional regulator
MESGIKNEMIAKGKKNEFLVLSFLEKHKFSTLSILQELLNISYQGVKEMIIRFEKREYIESHIFNAEFKRIKIVGLSFNGINHLCDLRYERLPENATETQRENALKTDDSAKFYMSKFPKTQYKHNLAIQQFHVNVYNTKYESIAKLKPKKINIIKLSSNDIKKSFKGKKVEKRPDLEIISESGNIAVEVEVTAKSKARYVDLMKQYKLKLDKGDYHYLVYAIPDNKRALRVTLSELAEKNGFKDHFLIVSV